MSVSIHSTPFLPELLFFFPILSMRDEERRNAAGQVMADLERNKPASAGMVLGGLSPLSETLWKDKANTEIIGTIDHFRNIYFHAIFVYFFGLHKCLIDLVVNQKNQKGKLVMCL